MERRRLHAWPRRTASMPLTNRLRAPARKRNQSDQFGVAMENGRHVPKEGGAIPMKPSPAKFAIRGMAVALACLAVAEFSYAQMSRGGAQHPSPVTSGTDSMQTELHMLTDVQRQGVDRKEENAYKA